MDAKVHPEAAIRLPRHPSPARPFDVARYDPRARFSDNMLSNNDIDDSESESSIDYRGESIRSTSAKTHDVPRQRPPPPPPPPPYNPNPGHMPVLRSGWAPPPASVPINYHQNVNHHRLIIPPSPPPPPPPPPPETLRSSRQNVSHGPQRHRPPPPHPHPPPPPPPGSRSNIVRQSEADTRYAQPPPRPPPPPPNYGDPLRSRPSFQFNIPPPPSPDSHSLASPSLGSPLNQSQDVIHRQSRTSPTPNDRVVQQPPRFPNGRNQELRTTRARPRPKGSKTRKSRRYYEDSCPDLSDPSTYSPTRPMSSDRSVSEISSEEDLTAYLNARQFPPLLPADSHVRTLRPKEKAALTNKITSWVAQYERSQSPWKDSQLGIAISPGSKDIDLGEEKLKHSDTSSDGEPEHLWTQLKQKRVSVSELKAQMAIKRKELRELRRQTDDADNAFMNVTRPILLNQRSLMHIPRASLEQRLADMQRLRTEYYYLESSYEGLEFVLDEEEVFLNNLETRFFSLLAAGRMRTQGPSAFRDDSDEEDEITYQDMPLDLKGISPEGPPEYLHPLYTELTSAIGDLQNAEEELNDLLFVKEEYDYDAELKRKIGQKPADDESEFYEDFPEEQTRMMGNIEDLKKTVANLKQECETKGVMRKHMSSEMEYLLYSNKPYEDITLDDKEDIRARCPSLAHPLFPILLTQPEHVLADGGPQTASGALKAALRLPNDDPSKQSKIRLATKECTIDRLSQEYERDEEGDKGDLVNRWLLQQLRTSPLNAHLLQSTFTGSNSLKIRDPRRWQTDVLRHWWRDTTTTMTDGSNIEESTKRSRYESRVGTPQRSRAASDLAGKSHFRHDDKKSGSDDQTIYEEPVFPNSYPTPTGVSRSQYFS